MSVQQYFAEVEAVVAVLQEFVNGYDPDGDIIDDMSGTPGWILDEEHFAAIWQAAELLARAHAYISAQVNAEMAMAALNLPDPQEKKGPSLIVPGGGLVP